MFWRLHAWLPREFSCQDTIGFLETVLKLCNSVHIDLVIYLQVFLIGYIAVHINFVRELLLKQNGHWKGKSSNELIDFESTFILIKR